MRLHRPEYRDQRILEQPSARRDHREGSPLNDQTCRLAQGGVVQPIETDVSVGEHPKRQIGCCRVESTFEQGWGVNVAANQIDIPQRACRVQISPRTR